jgi:hypothetical protein
MCKHGIGIESTSKSGNKSGNPPFLTYSSVSCGYIAARVVAKLNSVMLSNAEYFSASVTDCNHHGRDDAGSSVDTVAIANIPGVSPHFL